MTIIAGPEPAVMGAVDDFFDLVDTALGVADQIQALARHGVHVRVDAEPAGLGVDIALSPASASLLPVLADRIGAPGTGSRQPGQIEAVGHLVGGSVSVRVTAPVPEAADGRTPAERALDRYLQALVREADARVPAAQQVPRTAAAMRARLAERSRSAAGGADVSEPRK